MTMMMTTMAETRAGVLVALAETLIASVGSCAPREQPLRWGAGHWFG